MNEKDIKTIDERYENGELDEIMQLAKVIVSTSNEKDKPNNIKQKFSLPFDSMKSLQDIIPTCREMAQPNSSIDITIDSLEALMMVTAEDMQLSEYVQQIDFLRPDEAEEEMEYAMEEMTRLVDEFNAIIASATQGFKISSVHLIRRMDNPPPDFKCAMDEFEKMTCQHLNVVN